MIVSASRMKLLMVYAALESSASPERRRLHEQEVVEFLDGLLAEANDEGTAAFLSRFGEHEDPWAAVRVREYTVREAAIELERRITRAPAALSLVLARRSDLDPEQDGDELAFGDEAFAPLVQALLSWDTGVIRRHIGPLGWSLPEVEIEFSQDAQEGGQ